MPCNHSPQPPPTQPLTERQAEIYAFLVDYFRRHGWPPTVREIGDAWGISSPNGVICHLKALTTKGWIDVEPKSARGIRLLQFRLELVPLSEGAEDPPTVAVSGYVGRCFQQRQAMRGRG